jgi:CubicO group peptidase (beta-lactamase class C family)
MARSACRWFAGAVVVIVKDGSVLTQRGYGYADLAARRPMDPERTLLRAGSVSKLFTWTALMQLVERGKVALDADVNTYLDFQIPARDGKPITVRNLMTHTPGFEEQLKSALTYDPAAAQPFDALLKRWIPERIFAPGTMPAYSNYGAALAGYIVQRVSGMAFDDYMEAHVLGPLGMTSSTFRQPLPSGLQARMAKGYATASSPERPFEIVGLAPGGALSAPATDVAKFMLAHLQRGRLGAGRMLLRGKGCAEVAAVVGVARQTVYTWKRLLDEGGIDALRGVPERGRPAQLDEQQLAAVRAAVLRNPTEHGFGTELWTLKRVGAVIERLHGVRFGQTQVWRILGNLGFSPQKPEKRAIERDENAVRTWKRSTWPRLKKKPSAKRA